MVRESKVYAVFQDSIHFVTPLFAKANIGVTSIIEKFYRCVGFKAHTPNYNNLILKLFNY